MDEQPPRAAGDERATLQSLLQYHRESFLKKLDGLTEERARWSPVPTGTSLLWLAKHLTYAETIWILVRFDGQDPGQLDNDLRDDDRLEDLAAQYRRTWERVDAVVAGAELDTVCTGCSGDPLPDLRWILAHLLEETARHAGHADILRELIDGETGR
jgi:hypothetical protein